MQLCLPRDVMHGQMHLRLSLNSSFDYCLNLISHVRKLHTSSAVLTIQEFLEIQVTLLQI